MNIKKQLVPKLQLGNTWSNSSAVCMVSRAYIHAFPGQSLGTRNCSIISGFDLESTVSIRVDVKGNQHIASGCGNGGFDAFIDAINKVMKLHDYLGLR